MEGLLHKSWLFMCLRCSYTVSQHKKHKKHFFRRYFSKKGWKKYLNSQFWNRPDIRVLSQNAQWNFNSGSVPLMNIQCNRLSMQFQLYTSCALLSVFSQKSFYTPLASLSGGRDKRGSRYYEMKMQPLGRQGGWGAWFPFLRQNMGKITKSLIL